jgi:hypothetical protein
MEAIKGQIEQVVRRNAELSADIQKLETARDTLELRSTIRQQIDVITKLVKDTRNLIQKEPRSLVIERMNKQLGAEYKKMQDMAALFGRKEAVVLRRSRDFIMQAESEHKPVEEVAKKQITAEEQINLEVLTNEVAALEEREEKLKHLEGEVRQLADLFKDVAELINGQDEAIHEVAKNVEATKERTVAAEAEIQEAARLQEKKCIIS